MHAIIQIMSISIFHYIPVSGYYLFYYRSLQRNYVNKLFGQYVLLFSFAQLFQFGVLVMDLSMFLYCIHYFDSGLYVCLSDVCPTQQFRSLHHHMMQVIEISRFYAAIRGFCPTGNVTRRGQFSDNYSDGNIAKLIKFIILRLRLIYVTVRSNYHYHHGIHKYQCYSQIEVMHLKCFSFSKTVQYVFGTIIGICIGDWRKYSYRFQNTAHTRSWLQVKVYDHR